MGFGWRELLIIAVIVLLIFGTKKLANIGKDLGGAVGGFKKGMKDANTEAEKLSQEKEKEKDSGSNA